MDMIGIDFVGPISPCTHQANRYILLAVDYFSRYLFARPTRAADGPIVVNFVRDIAKTLWWPTTVYCDNAIYFVKGVFPEKLRRWGILLFPAPITHPSSVGLAEKYVHLTMTALRTILAGGLHDGEKLVLMSLERWDECLNSAVFVIDNRIAKTHGFSPAHLLFAFTPHGHPKDFTVREEMVVCSGLLAENVNTWTMERSVETWILEDSQRTTTEEEYSVWKHLSELEEKW